MVNNTTATATTEAQFLHFFEEKWKVIRGVEINPFETVIEGVFLLSTAGYIKKFIDTFARPSDKIYPTLQRIETGYSRLYNRIIAGVGIIGSGARFLDLGVDKNWFVIEAVNKVALKSIAHVSGIFQHIHGAMEALNKIDELERLSQLSHDGRITGQKRDFDAYMYGLWANYASNVIFAIGSGLQLFSVAFGAAVTVGTINFLLMAGVVFLLASIYLQSDKNVVQNIEYLRTQEPIRQYSYMKEVR